MSRPGRCIDNGPIESFWGTLKEKYVVISFQTYESLFKKVEEYPVPIIRKESLINGAKNPSIHKDEFIRTRHIILIIFLST